MEETASRRWWLPPLLAAATLLALVITACGLSETAREVLAKAVFNIIGAVSTPFILETTIAIVGLSIVLAYNHWRTSKETDEWVYLAQTLPDPTALAEGAETPPHRLDPIVLTHQPDQNLDLDARLAMVEGFLDLGMKKEALDHLDVLPPEQLAQPRAQRLAAAARE